MHAKKREDNPRAFFSRAKRILNVVQLALVRVQREQPAIQDRSRWLDWERLHIELLAELGRHALLLKRVERLPSDATRNLQQAAMLHPSVPLDLPTLQVYASAVGNLNRAGLVEDAKMVQDKFARLKLVRTIPPGI